MRRRVNLRFCKVVDFRKSEKTSFYELPKVEREAMRSSNEAICFISGRGDQVVFVYQPASVSPLDGTPIDVLPSSRLRLGRNRWNRYMLQNYANEVGLELVGLPRFEKILEEAAAERRERRRSKKK